MPTTENDRRNAQQPVLQNPSLPDHNRLMDEGMHAAVPTQPTDVEAKAEFEDLEVDLAAPDQEFGEILKSGFRASGGRIPEDPNNWNTSEPEKDGIGDGDPEDRGESLPDILDNIQH